MVSVALFVFGCNNPADKSADKTSSETTSVTDKSNDPSEMTIPDFSNHELTDFCKSYKSHINQLISVLKNNDNAALKQPYENYMSSFDQLSKMITKARLTGPEELKNLNLFLRKTRPFLNEINQAPGIQKLVDEHYAQHK